MCGGNELKFIPQTISDVILIKPKIYKDDRGYFYETFRKDLFRKYNWLQC